MNKEKSKRTENIPEEKLERVSELVETIKNKKTILLSSIKNIPASQYQQIVKKLRGKAIVKFPKKTILFRAIDKSGIEAVKKIKEHIQESTAVLFSDMDSFELAAELLENKTPARAKAGQTSTKDIEISEGPTDLVPGPAISELGALGIPIQIEKGKINIKKTTTIVKEGEKISAGAADIMNKLDIKPFKVGFTPFAVFDKEKEKLYLDISIDKEKTVEELKYAFGRALPFAVEIGYANEDTIKFMIGKAGSHEKALGALVGKSDDNQESPKGEEDNNEETSEKAEDSDEKDGSKKEPKESGEKEDKEEEKEEDKSEESQESSEEKDSNKEGSKESGDKENDNQNKSKEEK